MRVERGRPKFMGHMLVLAQALGLLVSTGVQAQENERRAVMTATLSSVSEFLLSSPDAVTTGPIALDRGILRADWHTSRRVGPDSIPLAWVGDVRDSQYAADDVGQLLGEANASMRGPVQWVECGTGSGAARCTQRDFSAILVMSEPWINGNVAQVLVSLRYQSTGDLHPSAWQASVVRFERVGGRWLRKGWYNQASN